MDCINNSLELATKLHHILTSQYKIKLGAILKTITFWDQRRFVIIFQRIQIKVPPLKNLTGGLQYQVESKDGKSLLQAVQDGYINQ